MSSYLIEHAQKNVWCTPDQDHQFLFKPARLTPNGHARNRAVVEWDTIELPSRERYHVYQIGQLSPYIPKLLPDSEVWYSAAFAVSNLNIIIDVYDSIGREIDKSKVFVRKTKTRNLIVTILNDHSVTRLEENDIFIRFYSNDYFNSERSDPTVDKTYSESMVVTTRSSIIKFQNKVRAISENNEGHVYLFHNGWIVDKYNPDIVTEGDTLELVLDTTIKHVENYELSNIKTFVSKLDRLRKYLIYRPKAVSDSIEYIDDVDIWIYKDDPDYGIRGLFYHKASEKSTRMVTHKDYSIPVMSITNLVNRVEQWTDLEGIKIRLHIRKSGYSRPLVFENSRINDLMLLADPDIEIAMTGTNSTIKEWQAAYLELSSYSAVMRANPGDISAKLVQQAYGYNAASVVLGDTPKKPVLYNGLKVAMQPYKLRYNATMFEYDVQGRLISYSLNSEGQAYKVKHEHTGYVEGIVGIAGPSSGLYYDALCVDLAPGSSYAAYFCAKIEGIPTYDWQYAVERTHYVHENDQIAWLIDLDEYLVVVKTSNELLVKDITVEYESGIIFFPITSTESWCGEEKEDTLEIQPGKLDVFLNGHPLIENLDYFVKWPNVLITNKEYLATGGTLQQVTYRCSGFCTVGMERQPVREFGFIQHGLLSRNNRFDVRRDKVLRYVVEGRLYHRDELVFSETDSGIAMEGVREGAPYQIDDIVVPMDEFIDISTYAYRSSSEEIDTRVSNYMTLYFPEPEKPLLSIIERRYQILSPFISKIHYDLASGYLRPEGINGQYGDSLIRSTVESYMWLLDYDPLVLGVDLRYVIVHPHNLFTVTGLDVYQYNFLTRLINLYFKDKIDISTHIKIIEE